MTIALVRATEWLESYVQAWTTYDAAAIGALFSVDVVYHPNPFVEPLHGRDAVVAFWLNDRDTPGTYSASYASFLTDGAVVMAAGQSRYYADAGQTELRTVFENVFLLRFDADSACIEYREWYMERPTHTIEAEAPAP